MIDINFIKENPALFMKLMKQRNVEISIEEITALEKKKKKRFLSFNTFKLKEMLYLKPLEIIKENLKKLLV